MRPRSRLSARLVAARALLVVLAVVVPLIVLEAAFRWGGPFLPGQLRHGRVPGARRALRPLSPGELRRLDQARRVRGPGPHECRAPAWPDGAAREGAWHVPYPGAGRLVRGGGPGRGTAALLTRLTDLLNADGGPVRYELIDGSCGGWGTVQEYLYLQEEGPKYQPDLVLLAFFVGNDVANNSALIELDGNLDAALKPYMERRPAAILP